MAAPEVLALLPDGRALVTQPIDWTQRLVRLWTVSTNTLETLYSAYTPSWSDEEPLSVRDDGRYLFEIVDRTGEATVVRVFDLETRQFATETPLEIAALAVSSNGRAILDRELRRFTIEGQPDFDFAPLVATAFPAATNWRRAGIALSPTGSAVAVAARVSAQGGGTSVVVAAHQDGRLITLAEAAALDACPDRRTLSFSADERFVLAFACGVLRVWDLESGTTQLESLDTRVMAAAFTKTGSRLITADANGVIERDLDGANSFAWAVDGQRRFALGPGSLVGHRDRALVVLAGAQVVGTWRHPDQTWERAVAITDAAAFTIIDDWDSPTEPKAHAPMLARFAVNRAGPTATLSSNDRQSEWHGQIALSPDERRLAVVFPDSVHIVDSETLTLLAAPVTEAGAIAWSPDGRYLAATPSIHYRDPGRVFYRPAKAVDLWDAGSGALVARLPTPIYPLGITFDDTGRTIRGWGADLTVLSGSGEEVTDFRPTTEGASFRIDLPTGIVSPTSDRRFLGSARDLVADEEGVFRVSTGAALASFWTFPARRAVFSSDLSLVLVLTDTQYRLWAVGDGHAVAEKGSLDNAARSMALSHDGRRLFADRAIFCLR